MIAQVHAGTLTYARWSPWVAAGPTASGCPTMCAGDSFGLEQLPERAAASSSRSALRRNTSRKSSRSRWR